MTGRTSRIRKYMLCFQKICNFQNYNFIEKKIGKKLIFFLAILKFLMSPLDAQQNFMLLKYNFFLSIFVRSKVIANLAFLCRNLGWVSERNRSRIAEIVAAPAAIIAAATKSQLSVSQNSKAFLKE